MDDTLVVHEKRKAEEKAHDILALKNPEVRKKVNKYDRIRQRPNTKSLKDKKLKSFLKKQGDAASHAATKAARSELLLLEDPGCVSHIVFRMLSAAVMVCAWRWEDWWCECDINMSFATCVCRNTRSHALF